MSGIFLTFDLPRNKLTSDGIVYIDNLDARKLPSKVPQTKLELKTPKIIDIKHIYKTDTGYRFETNIDRKSDLGDISKLTFLDENGKELAIREIPAINKSADFGKWMEINIIFEVL